MRITTTEEQKWQINKICGYKKHDNEDQNKSKQNKAQRNGWLEATVLVRTCLKWKWRTKNCRIRRDAKASIRKCQNDSEEQRNEDSKNQNESKMKL